MVCACVEALGVTALGSRVYVFRYASVLSTHILKNTAGYSRAGPSNCRVTF